MSRRLEITRLIPIVLSTWILAFLPSGLAAQDILLDRPVRAGNLTVFPSLSDTTTYYYVPDQVRLATNENGLPAFSFLRYVTNTDSGTDAEGGGIVHAVVELNVSEQEIERAQEALEAINSDATIAGPIVYRSGVFGLVSSFREENGDLTRQVVGLGAAPILDGGRAAISLRLTKLGAQILWESFQLPTPDISFSFEMEMAGYHSPVSGVVKANFDRLYNSHTFGVGAQYAFIGAEIKAGFDKAVEDGVITVETVGSDAQIDRLIQIAYDKLTSMMFDKQTGQAAQRTINQLAQGSNSQPDLLSKAGELIASSGGSGRRNATPAQRQEASESDQRADEIRQEISSTRDLIRKWEEELADAESGVETSSETIQARSAESDSLQQLIDELDRRREELLPKLDENPDDKGLERRIDSLGNAAAELENQHEELLERYGEARSQRQDGDERVRNLKQNIAQGKERVAELEKELEDIEASGEEAETQPSAPARGTGVTGAGGGGAGQSGLSNTGFGILATYQFKREKREGTFTINMNRHSAGTLSLRFDENIGDLRRYVSNEALFKSVNLDDPLYRQREILVTIDGLNADHFGNFVNFVSVMLKKRHQDGSITDRELTIRRQDFNRSGNDFRMIYGWNGDNNRERWLDYEYKSVWSLFGNITVERPWVDWQAPAIPLSPPYRPTVITMEAFDTSVLEEEGVRAIRVNLYQLAGESEIEKPVTLVPARGEYSKEVELLVPADDPRYAYEITWIKKGREQVSTGRIETTDDLILLDELPG